MRAFLSVAAALFCGALGAAPTTCTDLNRLWSDRYRENFHVALPMRQFTCPDSTDYKIARAIHDLKSAGDKDYYFNAMEFLVGEIVVVAACESTGRHAQSNKLGKIALCPPFFGKGYEESWRASVLYHEGAHINYYDPGHVVCEHGIHKGQEACDAAIVGVASVGSGYNWQIRYLRAVEEEGTRNDLDKRIVRKYLEALLLNSFNVVTQEDRDRWLP